MTWDYVAGFFDGEGNVFFNERTQRIAMHNTDLAVLHEIRDFMGCGKIRSMSPSNRPAHWKECFKLEVQKLDDLARVIPEIVSRSHVKADALRALLVQVERKQQGRRKWGRLSEIGVEGVRRLYWDEKLSTVQIAARLGLRPGTVSKYMRDNKILRRTRSEYQRLRAA